MVWGLPKEKGVALLRQFKCNCMWLYEVICCAYFSTFLLISNDLHCISPHRSPALPRQQKSLRRFQLAEIWMCMESFKRTGPLTYFPTVTDPNLLFKITAQMIEQPPQKKIGIYCFFSTKNVEKEEKRPA